MTVEPLVIRRRVKASAERIFNAWTTPEQLLRWWGPTGVKCTRADIDLRVGGSYQLDNLLPDGTTISITGEFLQIDAPHELIYSWRTHPEAALERVTLRLEPVGDHTDILIIHERIGDEPTRTTHEAGWHGCLDGLEALVDGKTTQRTLRKRK